MQGVVDQEWSRRNAHLGRVSRSRIIRQSALALVLPRYALEVVLNVVASPGLQIEPVVLVVCVFPNSSLLGHQRYWSHAIISISLTDRIVLFWSKYNQIHAEPCPPFPICFQASHLPIGHWEGALILPMIP